MLVDCRGAFFKEGFAVLKVSYGESEKAKGYDTAPDLPLVYGMSLLLS